MQVQSVASSLCVPTPLRALLVYAAGVMQNCLRWSGCQPPALPSRFASYVQSPVALVVCWHLGISQALCALFWSAASPYILFLPPPTLGSCLLRSIARAVCPSAPQGGLNALTVVAKSTPDLPCKQRNLLVDHFSQSVAGLICCMAPRPDFG